MNNQEILDNAPEGATHCKDKPTRTDTVFYYKVTNDEWYFWSGDKWFIYHVCTTFMRSLKDIKRIVALEKSQNQLLSLIYNSAVGNVAMGYPVDIEGIASEAYGITGVSSEQIKRGYL